MAISTYGWQPPKLKMVQTKGTLELSDNASSFKYSSISQTDSYDKINTLRLIVTNPNLTKKEYASNLKLIIDSNTAGAARGHYENTIFKIPLNVSGEYSFEIVVNYTYSWVSGTHVNHTTKTEKFSCYIYVNPDGSKELKPYSLGDTIRRLLDLTPTRTTDEKNKFTFDSVQLAEYDKEESPEFAFTGHTLFEASLLIAQYKGAFPVLNSDGVISFRKLWSGKRYAESDLPSPIDDISSSDINQYCTYLETEVQNLIGINDSQAGSVVEPYRGGYKTTRAGSGSEISQDTAVISTDYNQYLHIKEEIGFIGGSVPDNNDITPYIYESGDYKALSEMTGAYPNSKAYALQWAQMSKDITELAHRVKSSSSIAQAFKEPAIANIIQAKTGESYDTGFVGYLRKLLNLENGHSFADLMFRTTYIPIINSRIKQYKDYFGEFHHDGSLKYNQTAELVDSELYGVHLKQLIRKLGNATKRKTYIFDRIDDIPKVGDLVGNYSVYDVQMSIRENEVVATLSFVKYAELSQYVGVKNPWKDSDVSTDKCYNRQVSFNEFLLFTHDGNKVSTSKSLLELGLSLLLPNTWGYAKYLNATCVEGTGYMSDGSELNTVLLPVVSLAVGNSLLFQWGYQNNYSAGYMSESAPDGATSVLSGTKYNRAQKAVKYTDSYGKMETYDFNLMATGPTAEESVIWIEGADKEWKPSIISYPGNVTFEIKNYVDIYVRLSEAHPSAVTVKFLVQNEKGKEKEYEVVVSANSSSTHKMITNPVPPLSTVTLISTSCYDTGGYAWYTEQNDIAKAIGNSLPLKPSQLRLKSDFSEWKGVDLISVKDLLVQKNSSEALTFSVQMHYCSDNENFIVGSGLTNFCPLIGGTVEEVALYGFPDRINIFNRRISVANAVQLALPDIQNEAEKISISLSADINNYQAWAYVGKDKNGNYQIIFGENKDLNGSAFETELYLLPMHKLEDFI